MVAEDDEVASALMRLAWSSVAALAIAPLQDLLDLGREARMNVPGRAAANWRWRCTRDMLSEARFEWLRDLTTASHRSTAQREATSTVLRTPCDPTSAGPIRRRVSAHPSVAEGSSHLPTHRHRNPLRPSEGRIRTAHFPSGRALSRWHGSCECRCQVLTAVV